MALDKLRYLLTNHRERIFISAYENFKLLVHPSIVPDIQPTMDKTEIKFYM